MRIAVIGAGAIGGFIAAALSRAGTSVGVVARGAHLEAIRESGLHVTGDLGAFSASVDAAEDLRRLGTFDALILTFKAHQWPQLLEQISDPRYADATIVTLQNGVPFLFERKPPLQSVDPGGAIASAFGDDRIVGGVVHVSGRVEAPGRIAQSGGLRYLLGAVSPKAAGRANALQGAMLEAGLSAELVDAIRVPVWLKLVNNVGLNAVSTLTGASIRSMLENPEYLAAVRDLMRETLDVGRAMGVVAEVDLDARLAYASRLDDVRTSMLQDYTAGKPLELDPMLGAVKELAQRFDVPVPHVADAYARLLRLAEAASRG
ncbi:MAG TPA: 2-dehydropantoate 2-reductase [Candidatus Tumulicola sp.]